MRVRYDEDAREDLRNAVSWYKQHRAGLGVRFHVSVMATERLIASAPRFHPITDRVGDAAIRRALIPEFPYALLYMDTAANCGSSRSCIYIDGRDIVGSGRVVSRTSR
jgi:hypothetical protein